MQVYACSGVGLKPHKKTALEDGLQRIEVSRPYQDVRLGANSIPISRRMQ